MFDCDGGVNLSVRYCLTLTSKACAFFITSLHYISTLGSYNLTCRRQLDLLILL